MKHHHKTYRIAAGIATALVAGIAVGVAVFFILRHSVPSESCNVCPEPRVYVEEGVLRGACRAAQQGRPQYSAFLGIPYAKPPIGKLRFKSPRRPEPWDGVYDALKTGPVCMQGPSPDKQTGDEDCLHLNVYSPRLSNRTEDLLPVLVHVHGGAMKEGSGTLIQPDYFIAQDLVVVTFNYRLNRFGFLNLETEEVPGNAGLKDMVEVLRWIQRNIRQFGGDPQKVTINGCSSAATAVHWLTLLPATEGLFRAAIIKSGSALVSWGYSTIHRELSHPALQFLKYWFPNATEDLLLHNSPALLLDLAFTYAESHRNKADPERFNAPTVSLEKHPAGNEAVLIERDPESYVLRPARSRLPLLMGVTDCEYDALGDMFYMLGEAPPVFPAALVPRSVIPANNTRQDLGIGNYSYTWENVAADIRSGLFNTSVVDPDCDSLDIICRWRYFYSDAFIRVDSVRAMRMHAQADSGVPVYAYYYEFPVDGKCAFHAHDDGLVWPEKDRLRDITAMDALSLNTLRQVTLFANFVKYSDPVPKTDDTVLTTKWLPMSKDGPDVFMRIGKNLKMDSGDIVGKYGKMWMELYSKYRYGRGM